eukprot:528767-Pelagomonas_calceolata.AAC.1
MRGGEVLGRWSMQGGCFMDEACMHKLSWRLMCRLVPSRLAIWSNSTSPVFDICISDDMQDEKEWIHKIWHKWEQKTVCCSDVPIPRSALSVKNAVKDVGLHGAGRGSVCMSPGPILGFALLGA